MVPESTFSQAMLTCIGKFDRFNGLATRPQTMESIMMVMVDLPDYLSFLNPPPCMIKCHYHASLPRQYPPLCAAVVGRKANLMLHKDIRVPGYQWQLGLVLL